MGTHKNSIGEAILTSTYNLCFEQKYKNNIKVVFFFSVFFFFFFFVVVVVVFLSENFQFLEAKFSIYTERKKKRRVNFIPKFHSSLKKFVKYFTMITKRYMYGTKVPNFIGLWSTSLELLKFIGSYPPKSWNQNQTENQYRVCPPSYEYPQSMFWAEIWRLSDFFYPKIFIFLVVKFSIYLNRHVFVMSAQVDL